MQISGFAFSRFVHIAVFSREILNPSIRRNTKLSQARSVETRRYGLRFVSIFADISRKTDSEEMLYSGGAAGCIRAFSRIVAQLRTTRAGIAVRMRSLRVRIMKGFSQPGTGPHTCVLFISPRRQIDRLDRSAGRGDDREPGTGEPCTPSRRRPFQ